jgi:hypothetical protein
MQLSLLEAKKPAKKSKLKARRQSVAIQQMLDQAHNSLLWHEDKIVLELNKNYDAVVKEIEKELADMFRVHGMATKPDFQKYKQLQLDVQAKRIIENKAKLLNVKLTNELTNKLELFYKEAYNRYQWTYDNATPPNVKPVYQNFPSPFIRALVERPLKGARFSQRIGVINDVMANDIYNQLSNSIIGGDSVAELSKKIRNLVGISDGEVLRTRPNASRAKWRADMIARTELMKTSADASKLVFDANEHLIKTETWLTAEDERTCYICKPRNGLTKKEIIKGQKEGKQVKGDIFIPQHPNCILPDQVVYCPNLVSAVKSFYNGVIIKIAFSNGSKISVTQNHPILTDKGFIKAKFLNKSHDVLFVPDVEGLSKNIPNNNNVPTIIQKVFSSLKKTRGMLTKRMPVSSKNFYGDSAFFKGDINVVFPNRFLLGKNDVSFGKFRANFNFSFRNISFKFLNGFRTLHQMFERLFNSPNSVMSFFSPVNSLLFRRFFHSIEHGFRAISSLNSIDNQTFSDNIPRNTKGSRKFKFRFSKFIKPTNAVNIKFEKYVGHVYDLQSIDYELYVCNGIIVKNCRCVWLPVMKSWAELLGDDFKAMDKAEKDRMVYEEKGKFKAYKMKSFKMWQEQNVPPSGRGLS